MLPCTLQRKPLLRSQIVIIICMQNVSLIIKVERNDVNSELGHSFAGLKCHTNAPAVLYFFAFLLLSTMH